MEQETIQTRQPDKRYFRYLLIFLASIIVAKYVILWVVPPSEPSQPAKQTEPVKKTPVNTQSPQPKTVELSIDLAPLQKAIGREYEVTRKDVHDYIEEQIENQRQSTYYRLSRDEGFLDWIFGYFTGYKMMWKKVKGVFGSDDNEVRMVSQKFEEEVMKPNFNTMMRNIQSYTRNRAEDFYKSAVTASSKYLNEQLSALKQQGYRKITVNTQDIPWHKYIVSTGSDGFMLLELAGVTTVSIAVGKVVGTKVATLMGPKVLGLITTKTAGVVAGKIASSFSLLFAPLVDWAINEGSKQIMYDKTEGEFKEIIDDILSQTKQTIRQETDAALAQVKNDLFSEINHKQLHIKAVK